jgi:hypothetical protein
LHSSGAGSVLPSVSDSPYYFKVVCSLSSQDSEASFVLAASGVLSGVQFLLLVDRPVFLGSVGELGDFCGLFVKIGLRFRYYILSPCETLCSGILDSCSL